jgi:phosphate transport system ATP-binding protein
VFASSKIEELVYNLKKDLGELIEYGPTNQIFKNPQKEIAERYISGKFG